MWTHFPNSLHDQEKGGQVVKDVGSEGKQAGWMNEQVLRSVSYPIQSTGFLRPPFTFPPSCPTFFFLYTPLADSLYLSALAFISSIKRQTNLTNSFLMPNLFSSWTSSLSLDESPTLELSLWSSWLVRPASGFSWEGEGDESG